MSKKNNKSIKARAHAHDLERERLERERLAKQAAKNERKAERREQRAVASGGVAKKKAKAFRIRKGVKIRGIKVVDAETKHKLLKVLKKERAARLARGADADMGDAPGDAKAARSKPRSKSGVKVKMVKAKKGKAAAAGAEAAPMEG